MKVHEIKTFPCVFMLEYGEGAKKLTQFLM